MVNNMTEEEKKLRDELIELKIKYKKLKVRYEKVSDELLKYIVKYGRIKSGRNEVYDKRSK